MVEVASAPAPHQGLVGIDWGHSAACWRCGGAGAEHRPAPSGHTVKPYCVSCWGQSRRSMSAPRSGNDDVADDAAEEDRNA